MTIFSNIISAILHSDKLNKYDKLTSLVASSNYIKSEHIEETKSLCQSYKLNLDITIKKHILLP